MTTRRAAGLVVAALTLAACASSEDLRPAADTGRAEPSSQSPASPSSPGPEDVEESAPYDAPEDDAPEDDAPEVEPRPDSPRPGPSMPLPNVVGRVSAFTLPSGNIGCRLVPTEARCDIDEHTYRLPRRPASCDLAYGQALSIVVGMPAATFVCHGDTVLGAPRILQYGESTVVGDVGCTSSEEGVYCYDLLTGSGFQLQQAAARFF